MGISRDWQGVHEKEMGGPFACNLLRLASLLASSLESSISDRQGHMEGSESHVSSGGPVAGDLEEYIPT